MHYRMMVRGRESVMNYRMTVRGGESVRGVTGVDMDPIGDAPSPVLWFRQSEFKAPFRVFPMLEESSPYKVELLLKVRLNRMAGMCAAPPRGWAVPARL